jgi:hypothetical protein
MLTILNFDPIPRPIDWPSALGICAIDDEGHTYCHASLPAENSLRIATTKNVVLLLRVRGGGLLPLVPIHWALEHFGKEVTFLRDIEAFIRRQNKSGAGFTVTRTELDLDRDLISGLN